MTAPFIQTPKGVISLNRNGKAALEWNTNFQSKWQSRYTKAQKFMDSEVIRGCEPYTPLLTGMLKMSNILGTDVGSGIVKWIAPYARYQYYGKVMAGNPKVVTEKNLVYHGGGVRGAFWFERWKEVSGQNTLRQARSIAATGEK